MNLMVILRIVDTTKHRFRNRMTRTTKTMTIQQRHGNTERYKYTRKATRETIRETNGSWRQSGTQVLIRDRERHHSVTEAGLAPSP